MLAGSLQDANTNDGDSIGNICWTQRSPGNASPSDGEVGEAEPTNGDIRVSETVSNNDDQNSNEMVNNISTSSITKVSMVEYLIDFNSDCDENCNVTYQETPTTTTNIGDIDAPGETKEEEEADDFVWTARSTSISDASDITSGDDKETRDAKKKAKKLRYKTTPFLDIDDHEALCKHINEADDPYQAVLNIVDLSYTHKLDNDRMSILIGAISPTFRIKLPTLDIVPVSMQLKSLEAYIANRIISFELFDELFSISKIEEKALLGEFLIQQTKEASQCCFAEKVLNLFEPCGVKNTPQILTSLFFIFFKVCPKDIYFRLPI